MPRVTTDTFREDAVVSVGGGKTNSTLDYQSPEQFEQAV